jgi:hypothetical protein
MGGISRSSAKLIGDSIVFSGLATTDSNGGFTNAYGKLSEGDKLDFRNCQSLAFKAKSSSSSSDSRFEFSVTSGDSGNSMWGMGGATKKVDFYPTEEWQTFNFALGDFAEEMSGFGGQTRTSFDWGDVDSIGLRRSAFKGGFQKDPDFVSGPFEVEVKDLQCGPSFNNNEKKTMDVSEMTWEVINDTVMGGISRSNVKRIPGDGPAVIEFSGITTTDSNGGFTNSYGKFAEPVDLSDCKSISFETKGDDTRYKLSLTSGQMSMFGGQAAIELDFYPPSEWTEMTFPMEEFQEQQAFGGFSMPDFDVSEVTSIGISHSAFLGGLTKDPEFKSGPFSAMFRNLSCNM